MQRKSVGIILIIFALLISGCGEQKQSAAGSEKDIPSSFVASPADTEGMMEIDTYYGMLYYPDQWEDAVTIEECVENEVLTVAFSTEISGQNYMLFTLEISSCPDSGSEIGKLTDRAGNSRNVYVEMEEIPRDAIETDNEADRLYAMQESLNDLIEHLN